VLAAAPQSASQRILDRLGRKAWSAHVVRTDDQKFALPLVFTVILGGVILPTWLNGRARLTRRAGSAADGRIRIVRGEEVDAVAWRRRSAPERGGEMPANRSMTVKPLFLPHSLPWNPMGPRLALVLPLLEFEAESFAAAAKRIRCRR